MTAPNLLIEKEKNNKKKNKKPKKNLFCRLFHVKYYILILLYGLHIPSIIHLSILFSSFLFFFACLMWISH